LRREKERDRDRYIVLLTFLVFGSIDERNKSGSENRTRGGVGHSKEEVGENKGRFGSLEGIRSEGLAGGVIEGGEGARGLSLDLSPGRAKSELDTINESLASAVLHASGNDVRHEVEETNAGETWLSGNVRGGDTFEGEGSERPVALDGDDDGARRKVHLLSDEDLAGGVTVARRDGDLAVTDGEVLFPVGELSEGVAFPGLGDGALSDGGSDLVGGGNGVSEANVRLGVGRECGRCLGGGRGRRRGRNGSCGGRRVSVGLANCDLECLGCDGFSDDTEVDVAKNFLSVGSLDDFSPAGESLASAVTRSVLGRES
jgi:hypothetical protein